jgi:hypothetical protein
LLEEAAVLVDQPLEAEGVLVVIVQLLDSSFL